MDQAKRLKKLEKENALLKRLLADAELDIGKYAIYHKDTCNVAHHSSNRA